SRHVAEDLEQFEHWQPHLHDLGECEVKHGVRVSVVNLYTDELGNPQLPEKLARAKQEVPAPRTSVAPSPSWRKTALIAGSLVLLLALAAGLWIFSHQSAPNPANVPATTNVGGRPGGASLPIPQKSIAVLPFDNLSRDPQNAFFADRVQDEILTNLAKIADLKVISRTSVMQYKSGIARNLRQIARELGVANILEGSAQKSGDAVRVNVQLIK